MAHVFQKGLLLALLSFSSVAISLMIFVNNFLLFLMLLKAIMFEILFFLLVFVFNKPFQIKQLPTNLMPCFQSFLSAFWAFKGNKSKLLTHLIGLVLDLVARLDRAVLFKVFCQFFVGNSQRNVPDVELRILDCANRLF